MKNLWGFVVVFKLVLMFANFEVHCDNMQLKIVVGVMFVYIFLWSNGLQILGWVVLACCLQDAI
jgi:hypothetical protein